MPKYIVATLLFTLFFFTNQLAYAKTLELKHSDKCGDYYQSGFNWPTCHIPTYIRGELYPPVNPKEIVYQPMSAFIEEIPLGGDMEYLFGKEEEIGIALNPEERFQTSEIGVVPKLTSPNEIEEVLGKKKDFLESKSYGEIEFHAEVPVQGGGTVCVDRVAIPAVFNDVWGLANLGNYAYQALTKIPTEDESLVFLKDSETLAFNSLCRKEAYQTILTSAASPQPLSLDGDHYQLASDKCFEGNCERRRAPEEDVCLLSETPVSFKSQPKDSGLENLGVGIGLNVNHLSGKNVKEADLAAYNSGEELYYGYTDVMADEIKGVYWTFVSPVLIDQFSDKQGEVPLTTNLPTREDNDEGRYDKLGLTQDLQEEVCKTFLLPGETESKCEGKVEVRPQPPGESGDFTVEKTANPTYIKNEELPKDIKFEIKVTAKYKSTKVTILNETTVTKKDGTTFKVEKDKEGKDITKWPRAGEPPINLEAGETWNTTYFITATRPAFVDSTVTDTVTVTAENIGQPGPIPGGGSCEICGLIGQQPGWKSQELIKILNNAGKAFGVPAGALAGILYYEGWHSGGLPRVHEFDDITVLAASKPGGKDPYCVTSSANARGPFQLTQQDTINGWPKYKNAAIEAGARTQGYTPEICNILDSAYAAAKKMRTDVEYRGEVGPCNTWRGTPPERNSCNWNQRQVFLAACRYYGKCGNYVCQNDPGGATSCYCTKAYTYQINYSCQEK